MVESRRSSDLRDSTIATSSKEQTGDVITFAQFEEGNTLNETRNDAEIGDESDNESIMTSEQDMENLYYNDELDHDLISTEKYL